MSKAHHSLPLQRTSACPAMRLPRLAQQSVMKRRQAFTSHDVPRMQVLDFESNFSSASGLQKPEAAIERAKFRQRSPSS